MIERNPGDLLFTYGLLRKGVSHEMSHHLEEKATYISRGRMKGMLYLVSYYPGIVLRNDGIWVFGDIYRIDSMDLWRSLDKFEGLPDEDEYRLAEGEVLTANGCMKCFVYEFTKYTNGMQSMPSGDFLQHLKDINN